MALDAWVLDLLRCPATGAPLTPVTVGGQEFLATPDGVRYPVLDGVPVLLVDAAVPPRDDAADAAGEVS
ncbi:Trm112 family protein [Kineococcus sp. SYSU DK001]|uniref:Trm112 family protein n=1 Tax=Kineococcus sp. SYSU DK001 TaxID=3383122 RepID=UPI003D7D998A